MKDFLKYILASILTIVNLPITVLTFIFVLMAMIFLVIFIILHNTVLGLLNGQKKEEIQKNIIKEIERITAKLKN